MSASVDFEAIQRAAAAARATRSRANGHASGLPPEPVEPLAAWTLEDMLALEPPAWVVEGHLQLGARALDFAPSGQHKTNLAVDLACHVAQGLDWHGHAVAAGYPVVIVATEDPHGAAMRVVGWHDYHGRLDGRVLVVPGGELRLNEPATVARLKATAALRFPGERVGFVVDHYDVSVEGDPTNTEEAKGAAEGLRELGQGAAFVLLLAHCPWTTDGRAKVPVTLWANVDARRKIERDEATGQATVTVLHQKNGRSGDVVRFEFEEHAFAVRGGEATCLIAQRLHGETQEARPAGRASNPRRPKPLGANERVVLQCLDAALADHGRAAAEAGAIAPDIPPRAVVVRWPALERACERYMPDKPGYRQRENLKRAVISLQARGLVRHVNLGSERWLWRASRDTA